MFGHGIASHSAFLREIVCPWVFCLLVSVTFHIFSPLLVPTITSLEFGPLFVLFTEV